MQMIARSFAGDLPTPKGAPGGCWLCAPLALARSRDWGLVVAHGRAV